ncbi:unnamed protein product, partial [Prorocentrum cordatum]
RTCRTRRSPTSGWPGCAWRASSGRNRRPACCGSSTEVGLRGARAALRWEGARAARTSWGCTRAAARGASSTCSPAWRRPPPAQAAPDLHLLLAGPHGAGSPGRRQLPTSPEDTASTSCSQVAHDTLPGPTPQRRMRHVASMPDFQGRCGSSRSSSCSSRTRSRPSSPPRSDMPDDASQPSTPWLSDASRPDLAESEESSASLGHGARNFSSDSLCSDASRNTSASRLTCRIGTVPWMSPELLRSGSSYTAKVDVYAYGVLLYEILFCEPPFAELEPEEVEAAVLAGYRPDTDWDGGDDVPSQLLGLMRACWHEDAPRRPSFDTLVGALAAFRREDAAAFEALLTAGEGEAEMGMSHWEVCISRGPSSAIVV